MVRRHRLSSTLSHSAAWREAPIASQEPQLRAKLRRTALTQKKLKQKQIETTAKKTFRCTETRVGEFIKDILI